MIEQLDELKGELQRLGDRLERAVPNSNSTITINGGGIGVWIATVCCALMLGMSVIGTVVIMDQKRKIADLQHYLSAIYMVAPSLKPTEDDQ